MATKSKIAVLIEQVFRDSGRGDEKLNIKRAVDDADFVSHIDPLEERVMYALTGAGFVLEEDAEGNYIRPYRLKPSGIQPELRTQLDVLDAEVRTHEQAIRQLHQQKDDLAKAAVFDLLPEPKPDPSDLVYSDMWHCDGSPTAHCVYDDAEDPANDSCLFCHQPYERK